MPQAPKRGLAAFLKEAFAIVSKLDLAVLSLSFRVSIIATILVAITGIPFGYFIARKRFRGRTLLQGLATLPLVLPPTVVGYFLLATIAPRRPFGRFWDALGGDWLVGNFTGLVVATSVVAFPLSARTAQGAIEAVDVRLEHAGAVMGLPDWKIFAGVTIPIARRGVLAGMTLAFARALGDFGTTLMVGGANQGKTITMPIEVVQVFESGDLEGVRNLAGLMAAIGLTILVVVSALERTKN